jgi:hypothetical protein
MFGAAVGCSISSDSTSGTAISSPLTNFRGQRRRLVHSVRSPSQRENHDGLGLKLIILVGLLLFVMSACSRLPVSPVRRTVPTPLPELAIEVVEMPERICIGDTSVFVVKTKPGNECFASIGYRNDVGSRIGRNLEAVVADEEGLCKWTWQVTDDAAVGTARFRADVEGYGHVNSTMPQIFEIEDCGR